MASTPIPLEIPPGMVLTQSLLAPKGRYVGGQWVRFWRGKPQKAGGYASLIAPNLLIGTPRGTHGWSDSTARQLIGVGTNSKLYVVSNADWTPSDVTPWRVSTASLTDPITTVSGSTTVTVAYTAHGASVGDYMDISGSATVGGIDPNGSWPIATVVDADHVTFIAPSAATSSATGGGTSAVTIGFEIGPGVVDPSEGYGWGAGAWGDGTWGTPRSTSVLQFVPRVWSIGNFGSTMIAAPSGGGVYSYDPTSYPAARAAAIAAAPTVCQGLIVTSDDIVIAYGSNYGGTQDLMQFWACAQGDYTVWDPTLTAGPSGSPPVVNRLHQGTRIVGGADLGVHVALLWTDTALYSLQYTGSQYVYDVTLAGSNCGLMSPLACVTVGSTAYWVGPYGFFRYDGSVSNIPNFQDVSEWVIANLRAYYTVKAVAWYNERYNEVWFGFVSGSDTEPYMYVAVSLDDFSWTAGRFPEGMACATKFTNADARPIVIGSDGDIYQFENGLDADGADLPYSIQSSPVELNNGATLYDVDGVAMDMERQVGNMTLTLTGYDRTPAGAVAIDSQSATVGPTDGMADFRASGRSVAIALSGSGLGCDFRLGIPKALVSQSGARR